MNLSHSSRETWLECRLRWWYDQHKEARPAPNSDLLRGTLGHAALEAFYSAAPARRTLDLLLVNARAASEEHAASDDLDRAFEQVTDGLKFFWRKFGNDEEYPVVLTERRLERYFGAFDEHEFHGILDGLVIADDKLVIIENKFPYSMPAPSRYLFWSQQSYDYAWLLKDTRPVFVVYNVVTPRGVHRLGPQLVPTWVQEEAGETNTKVIQEMLDGRIFPHYGTHCYRCPHNSECLSRIMGGGDLTDSVK